MDRYELIEGKSSKFWEVAVEGTTLTVRYGRIGTQGQTKDKVFQSVAAAIGEKDKLVKEKTGKGYALTGTVSRPPAPTPSVAPEPEPEPGPTAEPPPPQPAEPVHPTPPAAASDALETLLRHALPTRSRPQDMLDPAAAWESFCSAIRLVLPRVAEVNGFRATWLEARIGAAAPAPLSAKAADEWIEAILAGTERLVIDHESFAGGKRVADLHCLIPFLHWLLASAGGDTIADVALRRAGKPRQGGTTGYEGSAWSSSLDLALRHALVQAPEAEYEAILARLLQAADATAGWGTRATFAFILADDRPLPHDLQPLAVLQAAETAGQDVGAMITMVPLIADAAPSAAARWRGKRSYFLYFTYMRLEPEVIAASVVATARHHGESPLPGLDWLLHYGHEAQRTALARIMLATGADGALTLLLPHLHEKWIRAALDDAAEADPALTFRQCLAVLAAGRSEPAIKARVMEALNRHPPGTLRQWAAGDAKALSQLDRLLASRAVAMAPADSLPSVLRDPPWRKAARKSADLVLTLTPMPTPFRYLPAGAAPAEDRWRTSRGRVLAAIKDLPAVIAEIEGQPRQAWDTIPPTAMVLPKPEDGDDYALSFLAERVKEIYRARPYAVRSGGWAGLFAGIERQPEALALTLWECGGAMTGDYHWKIAFSAVLARFGERALPGLLKQLEADPVTVLEGVQDVDADEIAPHAARALHKLKKARLPAMAWLRRYPSTAITRLLPDALGAKGPARDAAENALRWLAAGREGARAAIEGLAADYAGQDAQVPQALAEVLNRDPLARFPARLAKLPAWFTPAALARPQLKAGGALPDDAVAAIAEMLSFSTPEAIYAGIAVVREACTRDSLAAFAWDLFSAWLAEGAPARDGWAMRALGWLGDDECARQLTRLIRKWPGEAAHARAVTGLDVLADIGTDVALMHLNGIAEKLKFKGLQERAREKIAALAEARDLTAEELADRLAPDLDLDDRGGLDIDFGARRFRAGFDEFLKPWVKDATGQRLKDLPKPNKSDDAELSADAVRIWAALKKDARSVASLQIARLETMLSTSRRVAPPVFWAFFASHPLIRHLAQRLVWGVYGDTDPRTAPSTIFRVAEDLSVTDAEDQAIALDVSETAAGRIGLVHPLHLPPGGLDAWGALFGDYEISQPFPQLGRDIHELTPAEKAASEIGRFEGIKVESPRVRGMAARGWTLGAPQDGGGIWWLERPVRLLDGSARTAIISFSDGLVVGGAEFEDKVQTLGKISLEGPYHRPTGNERHFGELDPVTASEMLRGLALLAETGVP
ncbi:MAG TPA: DUF4132 domain-containing protein [Roseomonas sp.]